MTTPEVLIDQFCAAANQHAAATECGDYKRGNKAHRQIIETLKQLELQKATELLRLQELC